MAQLMPLPLTVSCFSKIQIGFTFLVPAHLGSSGKRAVKGVYVYVTKQNTLTVHQLHYFSCVQETFQFTRLRNYIQLKPCYRNKTLTAYVHFGLSCVQNAAFGSDVGTKMFHHMIC